MKSVTECPLSTYQPQINAENLTDCQSCESGSYCPSPTNLINCPSGHFCDEGSIEPINCREFYYQENTGESECEICPEGYYCQNSVNKTICEVGYYCVEGSIIQTSCESGYYQDELGRKGCKVCPEGLVYIIQEPVFNFFKNQVCVF